MATIQGTGASVTLPTGFNVKAREFNATLDIPEVETTGFADNGWAVFQPAGPCRVTGTVSGAMQFDASGTVPASGTLIASTAGLTAAQGSITLQFKSGCTWAFTGNITQAALTRNV